jgi:hypothetical protein
MKKYKPYLTRVDLVKNQVERERIQEQEAKRKRKQRIQEQNRQNHLRYQEQLRSELAARYFHSVISAGGESFTNTQSIELDGIDAYVNQSVSTTSSTGSISVWIKPDLTNTRSFVVFDNGGYRNYMTISSRTDNKISVQCRINPTVQWNVETNNSVLSSTSWTHVVVTHNGTQAKIYIDGVAVPQTFTTSTNKTIWWNTFQPTLMRLGWFNINGYGRSSWKGLIDEFSLYETELNQSQITAIYNNGLPTSLTAYNSLVWLRCGDGDTQPTLINHLISIRSIVRVLQKET